MTFWRWGWNLDYNHTLWTVHIRDWMLCLYIKGYKIAIWIDILVKEGYMTHWLERGWLTKKGTWGLRTVIK